eukprot:3455032-Rhodomonas_salina.1
MLLRPGPKRRGLAPLGPRRAPGLRDAGIACYAFSRRTCYAMPGIDLRMFCYPSGTGTGCYRPTRVLHDARY